MAHPTQSLLYSIGTAAALGVACAVVIKHFYTGRAKRELRKTVQALRTASSALTDLADPFTDNQWERASTILEQTKSTVAVREVDLQQKLFRAGYFAPRNVRLFRLWAIASAVIFGFAMSSLTLPVSAFDPTLRAALTLLAAFVGFALPFSLLEQAIRRRNDQIAFYLPLTLEQVAIGVSSGLDIWPCICDIIEINDHRAAENPVIDLLRHVQRLVHFGTALETALRDVGEDTGITTLKHSFIFLAQVAEQGGEITKNLQEMADATMISRSIEVEGRIHTLPVKATGPLFCVFAGYFLLLLAGVFADIVMAFPF